jgi:hypothetical protein
MATWEIPELNSDFNGKVNRKRESLFIAMFDYQRVTIISFEFVSRMKQLVFFLTSIFLTNGHGSKVTPSGYSVGAWGLTCDVGKKKYHRYCIADESFLK